MGKGGGELFIGIFAVVISSLSTTFGLFFQKIALDRQIEYTDNYDEVCRLGDPDAYSRKTKAYWISGLLCITAISFVLDLYSMSVLGQSMVVPLLASLEVAENQMFAPKMLGERFDKCADTSSAIVIIFGALFTTLWGPGGPMSGPSGGGDPPPVSYVETKRQILSFFIEPVFIAFEVLVISLFIASLVVAKMPQFEKFHFLAVSYSAGFLGGQQNMFLKGVGICVTTAIRGDAKALADWMIYVFAVMMVGLASTQLYFLNLGLAQFDALLYVPTYTILYICSGTLVGLMFYREYTLMSAVGWVMFSIGFVFIGVALTILASKKPPPEEESEDASMRHSASAPDDPARLSELGALPSSPSSGTLDGKRGTRVSIVTGPAFPTSQRGRTHSSICVGMNCPLLLGVPSQMPSKTRLTQSPRATERPSVSLSGRPRPSSVQFGGPAMEKE